MQHEMDFEMVRTPTAPGAPCIWFIDAREHAFDLARLSPDDGCGLVHVFIGSWDRTLTPWPAPALFRGQPDFGGAGAETLGWLVDELLPAAREELGAAPARNAIAGYSLAGLFSLWALLQRPRVFDACACLSGSLWYEGWTDWLAEQRLDLAGHYAYLTLGTKEKRAARPQMKRVEDCARTTSELLGALGARTDLVLTPGGHFSYQEERVTAGLAAVSAALLG